MSVQPSATVTAARAALAQARYVVVKIGNRSIIGADPAGPGLFQTMADQISALRAEGRTVVLASSGAIALGCQRLKLPRKHTAGVPDPSSGLGVERMIAYTVGLHGRTNYEIPTAWTHRSAGFAAVPGRNEFRWCRTDTRRRGRANDPSRD
jgi:hypothetical protein